jgi:chorismate mutase / prephenate dehydrogenase
MRRESSNLQPESNPKDVASALAELRAQLDAIDASLVQHIAQRQALVAQIGALKMARGRQLRDFRREAEVLAKVRAHAQGAGLPEAVAEDVMKLLITASLTAQEQKRVENFGEGGDKQALVLGGNGKMGRWFASFLDTQGFRVSLADPTVTCAADAAPYRAALDWQAELGQYAVIVLSTPMRALAELVELLVAQFEALDAEALIFDLGSLKSPLKRARAQNLLDPPDVWSRHSTAGRSTCDFCRRGQRHRGVGSKSAVRGHQRWHGRYATG